MCQALLYRECVIWIFILRIHESSDGSPSLISQHLIIICIYICNNICSAVYLSIILFLLWENSLIIGILSFYIEGGRWERIQRTVSFAFPLYQEAIWWGREFNNNYFTIYLVLFINIMIAYLLWIIILEKRFLQEYIIYYKNSIIVGNLSFWRNSVFWSSFYYFIFILYLLTLGSSYYRHFFYSFLYFPNLSKICLLASGSCIRFILFSY